MNVNINMPGLDRLFAAIARRYELRTAKKFPMRKPPRLRAD